MSDRVGLTRMCVRWVSPAPLIVSPMIQRAVSPRRDRAVADEAFAGLEGDVGDLSEG